MAPTSGLPSAKSFTAERLRSPLRGFGAGQYRRNGGPSLTVCEITFTTPIGRRSSQDDCGGGDASG